MAGHQDGKKWKAVRILSTRTIRCWKKKITPLPLIPPLWRTGITCVCARQSQGAAAGPSFPAMPLPAPLPLHGESGCCSRPPAAERGGKLPLRGSSARMGVLGQIINCAVYRLRKALPSSGARRFFRRTSPVATGGGGGCSPRARPCTSTLPTPPRRRRAPWPWVEGGSAALPGTSLFPVRRKNPLRGSSRRRKARAEIPEEELRRC